MQLVVSRQEGVVAELTVVLVEEAVEACAVVVMPAWEMEDKLGAWVQVRSEEGHPGEVEVFEVSSVEPLRISVPAPRCDRRSVHCNHMTAALAELAPREN